jgi:DNA-binding YbaB/EbfC family protein
MMKQLEQLQAQMAQAQASLEEEVVTASVGGGVVTIEMTGSQELRSIKIKPEVLDPDDVEILEDLIMAAFQEAMQKAQQLAADRMGPLAGGFDIPGLL